MLVLWTAQVKPTDGPGMSVHLQDKKPSLCSSLCNFLRRSLTSGCSRFVSLKLGLRALSKQLMTCEIDGSSLWALYQSYFVIDGKMSSLKTSSTTDGLTSRDSAKTVCSGSGGWSPLNVKRRHWHKAENTSQQISFPVPTSHLFMSSILSLSLMKASSSWGGAWGRCEHHLPNDRHALLNTRCELVRREPTSQRCPAASNSADVNTYV